MPLINEHEYMNGDQPYGRRYPEDLVCPYCGGKAVIRGYNDVPEDSLRLDLYCDNGNCEVRTFTILARRIDTRLDRADVIALEEIDAGVGSERLPTVMNLMDPEDSSLIDAHCAGTLHRRTRETKVVLIPGDRYGDRRSEDT